MKVHKHGRTTGYTRGRVIDVAADLDISYDFGVAWFVDQMVIVGDSGCYSDSRRLGLVDRATYRQSCDRLVVRGVDLAHDRQRHRQTDLLSGSPWWYDFVDRRHYGGPEAMRRFRPPCRLDESRRSEAEALEVSPRRGRRERRRHPGGALGEVYLASSDSDLQRRAEAIAKKLGVTAPIVFEVAGEFRKQ